MTEAAVAVENRAEPTTEKERRHVLSRFCQWLAGVLVIAIFAMTFVVQAFEIPSESMEDTLLIGDYLLVNKTSFSHGGHWKRVLPYRPLQRGDIIVFRYPVHPSQHFVKRVIALPGDRVRMLKKQVFVNDQPVRETYTVFRSKTADPYRDDFPNTDYFSSNVDGKWWFQMHNLIHSGELTVPPGQYFVLGDNRDESLDSRYWGFVPEENIVGRPLLIYWSMDRSPRGDPVSENATLNSLAGFLRQQWNRLRRHRMLVVVN